MTGVSPVLIEALEKLGYQQGRNLKIIFRSAKDSNAELPELAAALVNQKPDVLVPFYTPPALALKNATAAIPIVMVSIGDPITTGLVKSLAHPGGNIPDDLPVQQPTKFVNVVNLKIAKAIGVEVPTSLLLSADRVIE
jgi:ABC-type uncharacterized transport system substrate-binding protein